MPAGVPCRVREANTLKVSQSQTDHRKKSVSSSLYFGPNFSFLGDVND